MKKKRECGDCNMENSISNHYCKGCGGVNLGDIFIKCLCGAKNYNNASPDPKCYECGRRLLTKREREGKAQKQENARGSLGSVLVAVGAVTVLIIILL